MPDEALCDGSPSGLACPFGVVVLLVSPSAVFVAEYFMQSEPPWNAFYQSLGVKFVAEYFMQSEPPSDRHCSTFFHAAC